MPSDPGVNNGEDPMSDPSVKIWGYETNWGSFAQFTRAQAHQCMPKAKKSVLGSGRRHRPW